MLWKIIYIQTTRYTQVMLKGPEKEGTSRQGYGEELSIEGCECTMGINQMSKTGRFRTAKKV